MKLDLLLVGCPLERAAETARRAEAAGFDGVWVTEVANDPFLTMAVGLEATSRLEMGTAIALAFVRSPMVTALSSWELQRASGGRFRLGLGPQVKAHNERRFSVPFEKPAAKLAEQVRALRAIWAAFAGDAPLDFHGEFYRFDLLTEFFDPGPIDVPPPPVYLAAVNPFSFRMAGEVADGVHVHPLHTVRYLTEVARPALAEGLARAGRAGRRRGQRPGHGHRRPGRGAPPDGGGRAGPDRLLRLHPHLQGAAGAERATATSTPACTS